MDDDSQKTVRVAQIANLMNAIAPSCLAEEWDNIGLQVGSNQWPVYKIWVALDPLLDVIADAARHQVDMVITHHPLILEALANINVDTNEGKIIETALISKIAVFAAHTNLDSAVGGLNDILARKIGLHTLKPLVQSLSCGDVHSVETISTPMGLGRIGKAASPQTVGQWVEHLKKCLGLDHVKVAGNLKRTVHRVAICTGSGGSLMRAFLDSEADLFISGDLKYHDARSVEEVGRAFVDIGHFASEHLVIEALVERLSSEARGNGWNVKIEPYLMEKDPLIMM